jgi:hypothetical protein
MQQVYEATIEAKNLYAVFGSLGKIVENYGCRLVFRHTGLSVKAVDPCNIMMVSLDVDNIALKVIHGTSITVGIDSSIEEIQKFLRPAKRSTATATISIYEEPCRLRDSAPKNEDAVEAVPMVRKMQVSYDILPGANVKADFSLVDPTAIRNDIKYPEVQLNSIWNVPAGLLKTVLNMAMFRKGKVNLDITNQMAHLITLDASGEQDAWFSLGSEYASAYQSNPPECLTQFSPAYLKDALTYAPDKAQVCIENNSDYPIRISYSIAAGIKASYFLAPRIEQQ